MSSISTAIPQDCELKLFGLKYENINNDQFNLKEGRFTQIDNTNDPIILSTREIGFVRFLKIRDKQKVDLYCDESTIVYTIHVLYRKTSSHPNRLRLFIVEDADSFNKLFRYVFTRPVAAGYSDKIF